jgi:2'-5' RNA ligase
MEAIRSFIAIELPGEVKLSLGNIQAKLKSGSRAPAKWVDPAIMHLTLKFMGYVDAGLIGKITSALEDACRGIAPFRLEMNGLGVFPNQRSVRVVWAGLTGELDKLSLLQKNIDSALAPLGFRAEARPFTPHLTLARVREEARPEERQKLGELVTGAASPPGLSFSVDSVHLMKSQLMKTGPVYTRLASVTLK